MSLAEVLVAMTIAIVVIGLITGLVIQLQRTVRSMTDRVGTEVEAISVEDRIRGAWNTQTGVRAIARDVPGGPLVSLWFDFTDRNGQCLAMKVTRVSGRVEISTGRYVESASSNVNTCQKRPFADTHVRWNANVLDRPHPAQFTVFNRAGTNITSSLVASALNETAWDLPAYQDLGRISYLRHGNGKSDTLTYYLGGDPAL